MAAGRKLQGTKSREILSQLIDRVGELSDALDAKAYSNNQIRSRREEAPASARLLYRKIRTYLPLPQRIQYYNSIISPVMSYVSAIWSNCDKELFFRVFKLQTRAARVILYAEENSLID